MKDVKVGINQTTLHRSLGQPNHQNDDWDPNHEELENVSVLNSTWKSAVAVHCGWSLPTSGK